MAFPNVQSTFHLLHIGIVCPCSYTQVSVVWRRTCQQLIYSRAMLKGRAAWRTPAPQLINLPNQYVMGSEGGSVAVGAGTSETAGAGGFVREHSKGKFKNTKINYIYFFLSIQLNLCMKLDHTRLCLNQSQQLVLLSSVSC